MDKPLNRYDFVAEFTCLGAACPDSCCRGWDMPVDTRQRSRYVAQAPELLAALDTSGGIMKRDHVQQQCAQLCEGRCGIHARYGEEFLGDACYFYPRLLHAIGDGYIMSGAISCPEILRLVLSGKAPFAQSSTQVTRLPLQRRDIVPQGWTPETVKAALAQGMKIAGDTAYAPEDALLYLLRFAQVISTATGQGWRYAAQKAAQLPMDDAVQALPSDLHALYYALALTESFGAAGISARLSEIMATMEQQLDCSFDRTTRNLAMGDRAGQACKILRHRWRIDAQTALAPVLRRWLQAQLAMTAFPFGGFPDITMPQRAAVLVQRFATVRLALMCHVSVEGIPPDEATVIRVIQGISRFMDHLADAELTLLIHRDSGWQSVARLRGLIKIG